MEECTSASIGQWLTPKLDIFEQDITNMVHLYRYENNDPINSIDFIRKFDGDYGHLPMVSMESWLNILGYRLDYIFGTTKYDNSMNERLNLKTTPILTSLSEEGRNLFEQFTHLSMIADSRIKLPSHQIEANSFLQMHGMTIATLPSTLSAVLIARGQTSTNVYSVETEKNPIINLVLPTVFNGTQSLPFHLVHHSKDEFI